MGLFILLSFLPGWSFAAQGLLAAGEDRVRIRVHHLQSPRQSAPTVVRVLLPRPLDPGKRYPVLYVLPVEAGLEHHYGDGLKEVQDTGLADRYGLICVAPSFASLPWYADHPVKGDLAQETYLIGDVLPLVEARYPVMAGRQGRWLVGFSKSGWGASSLLLRHPDLFDRAALWDAPLMMNQSGPYGSGPIFGTQENFKEYQLASLITRPGLSLGKRPRWVVMGYGNFKDHHDQFHERLLHQGIPHIYVEGRKQAHTWSGGWLPELVKHLDSLSEDR